MASLRVAAALVLLAVLASPTAVAAEAEGRLVVEGAAGLPDAIAGTAQDPSLKLDALPRLEAAAASVLVERYVERTAVQHSPAGPIVLSAESAKETTRHGASTLRLEAAPGGTPRLGLALAGASTLDATDATLRPVTGAHLYGDEAMNAQTCAPGTPCLAAFGVHELRAAGLALQGEGTLRLYLYDVHVTIEEGGATTRYESGASDSGTAVHQEDAELVLVLEGARVSLEATEPALYAPALRLETSRADFPSATGTLDVGARRYLARDDRVEALGTFVLEPDAVAPGTTYGALGETQYADAFETRISGDVQGLNLAAVPLYQDKPAEAAGFLALLAGSVAAIAYFWPHLQFQGAALLSPFYTRLQPPKLLDNDVRSHIYDIIRSKPGISARAIHRESNQSWGTVVYHLRQLEAHHLVVSRRFGRARNYYENHGKYRGMEQQLACLRSPRARALAHAILREPGITQEGLAEASGLAQPTTSYYARKLTHAQLVEEAREGRYVRYMPLGELERFLRLAEQADAPAAAAPAPAQA